MVKTLVDLCTAVCIRNIKDINDVGGLPYSILRPILMKIDNPAQLQEIEERSPQIQGDDAECWQRLINRDFPHQVKKHHFEPRNPTSWSKIYYKYKKIDTEEKRAALEKLTSSLGALKKEKQEKASTVVNFDTKLLGPAPGRRRGTGKAHDGSTGGLRWGGGSRTKITSARSVMQKARREAAEMSRRNRLATPTGQLPVRQGQITRAPLGMVEEHRIKSLPSMRKIQAPQPRVGERWEREQKEREARLLKAKNGTAKRGVTIVSDEELFDDEYEEDEEDEDQEPGGLDIDELEGLFDNKLTTSASSKTSKTAIIPSQSKGSSSRPPAPTSTATSGLSGLAKMKMGHSWKNRPTKVVPADTSTSKPAPKPTASSPTTPKSFMPTSIPQSPSLATSPGPGTAGPSTSTTEPKPKPVIAGQKRKQPPSIFMKPKPKARRMS